MLKAEKEGWHLAVITASAQNAKQRNSTDDDDLRIVINDYRPGKYELPGGEEHYQGFDSASSWNGATLKGNSKAIYLFFNVEEQGEYRFQFYADNELFLKNVEFHSFDKNEVILLEDLNSPEIIDVDTAGIPWISFVFIGPSPKSFKIDATARSGKQKGGTDGDSLKVVLNGEIIPNPDAPDSNKYKNFYFSGDQMQGEAKGLLFPHASFMSLENSVELWYDQNPKVNQIEIRLLGDYRDLTQRFEELGDEIYTRITLSGIINWLRYKGFKYASGFLAHSLSSLPDNLKYGNRSDLVKMIKKDPAYTRLLNLVGEAIKSQGERGVIFTGASEQSTITFESVEDLEYSIHGIKKIEYTVRRIDSSNYRVKMTLFDIYDFDLPRGVSIGNFAIAVADRGEQLGIVNNFEIRIEVYDNIKIPDK